MKNIKITRSGIYANPIVSLPHVRITKGLVYELDDILADRIVSCSDGEIVDQVDVEDVISPESSMSIDNTGGWSGDIVASLVENHKTRELKAACADNGLETDGNKTDLAKRLVSAGITEI